MHEYQNVVKDSSNERFFRSFHFQMTRIDLKLRMTQALDLDVSRKSCLNLNRCQSNSIQRDCIKIVQWVNRKFEFEKLNKLIEKRFVEIIYASENVTTSLVCVIYDSIFKMCFENNINHIRLIFFWYYIVSQDEYFVLLYCKLSRWVFYLFILHCFSKWIFCFDIALSLKSWVFYHLILLCLSKWISFHISLSLNWVSYLLILFRARQNCFSNSIFLMS